MKRYLVFFGVPVAFGAVLAAVDGLRTGYVFGAGMLFESIIIVVAGVLPPRDPTP